MDRRRIWEVITESTFISPKRTKTGIVITQWKVILPERSRVILLHYWTCTYRGEIQSKLGWNGGWRWEHEVDLWFPLCSYTYWNQLASIGSEKEIQMVRVIYLSSISHTAGVRSMASYTGSLSTRITITTKPSSSGMLVAVWRADLN